ncbi:MAG: 30S ribosomal protein S5 [Candidatus Hadarchaeum sp.]|uniref:30S ribosomal protein S5 n=1 Tax=Candidatus Hadarchaeum sp. TaxID=2883567 RepID=UPI00317CCB7D
MRRQRAEEFNIEHWQPRTSLGRQVKEGKITDISQILRAGKPIKESEIVDALVPNIQEEILEVTLVQRMHKSGRRVKYRVVAVVGNRDGIVGVGHASARDIGSSIKKAVNVAKLNVIEVARGCGSWECGCGRSHSVPFEVSGKSGSVKVFIKPAPRGLGLASAEIPKTILRMAGILDAWTRTEGETRTTLNLSMAVMEALKQTTKVVMSDRYRERVVLGKAGVVSG